MLQIRGIQYTPLIHDKAWTQYRRVLSIPYKGMYIREVKHSHLHQTANAKLHHVAKFPLYLLFTIHYFDT